MLDTLQTIVREVNAAVDLPAAMDIIVKRIRANMETQACAIYLRDKNACYVMRATEGLSSEAVGRVSMNADEGLVGYVAKRVEPINIENAESHPRYKYFSETKEERVKSFLGVPIIHQREVLGVLTVQRDTSYRFDESEEAFLVTISAQLSGIIAHAAASGALSTTYSTSEDALFVGVGGAPGVAIGTCVVVSTQADLASVPYRKTTDIDAELVFFDESLKAVRADIKQLGERLKDRLNSEELSLFEAYLSMLDDASLAQEVTKRIKEGIVAPYAWSETILRHAKIFSAMHDPYLRERSADIRDLGRRVLSYLQSSDKTAKEFPDKTILVGEELTASILGEVPKGKLVGLVSVQGSKNSHIAILARSMGIPTVMGAVDLPFTQLETRTIIVDGYRGNVYSDPNDVLLKEYQMLLREDQAMGKMYESLRDLPCETLDNHRVSLWVNTGLMADISRSLERGAEGVGLYRTEVPFSLRDRFPTEEEQRIIYREQLQAFAPYTVTMRTLDVGGDKALSYFPIEEDNPFLGWRGIRVTLDHPEIFLAQVRAMMKASDGFDNLRIMLPMVSSIPELEAAQTLTRRAFEELLEEGLDIEYPPIGVMVEVPAAVYQTKELAARADFLSVGSNDLTQYLLAVDRNNAQVADLYNSFHPAVLEALYKIVVDAKSQQTPVSICGELAGNPGGAILLMAMGYNVLSMSATNLPKVKSVIRAITQEQAKSLLDEVVKLPDAQSVNDHMERSLKQLGVEMSAHPLSLKSTNKD